jgi:hypothetical protein
VPRAHILVNDTPAHWRLDDSLDRVCHGRDKLFCNPSDMTQGVRDQLWIPNTGDDPQLAAALRAGFNLKSLDLVFGSEVHARAATGLISV